MPTEAAVVAAGMVGMVGAVAPGMVKAGTTFGAGMNTKASGLAATKRSV